ncbi:hypothetical protein CDL12_01070 [Handroanthus impetiginosus]|uniref:Uncharacterized protein n=1 Tax=Handroanthus impetiginosus TaxID=429701 RepID=A0A2G9I8W3_9LAMI|nr:hypothetical protein CDL12_01070 [Handroanthus impetiginosus]
MRVYKLKSFLLHILSITMLLFEKFPPDFLLGKGNRMSYSKTISVVIDILSWVHGGRGSEEGFTMLRDSSLFKTLTLYKPVYLFMISVLYLHLSTFSSLLVKS